MNEIAGKLSNRAVMLEELLVVSFELLRAPVSCQFHTDPPSVKPLRPSPQAPFPRLGSRREMRIGRPYAQC